MSILGELLLDLLAGGLGPSSDRGLVATFAAGSVGLLLATLWLIATSPDPLRQPDLGWAILAGSLLCGTAGLLVSVLHLRRSQSDRQFSVLCLTSNVAAIAVPVIWLTSR